jgi:PAS domain S-box-containing protein
MKNNNTSLDKKLLQRLMEVGVCDFIGDGISIQDTDFKILYQNKVSKSFIGDHVGKYCYEAYEGRETVCEGCPVENAFEDGQVHTVERKVPLNGEILYFEVTASRLRDEKGDIIAGIAVVRDITERKKVEQAIQFSAKQFRDLVDNSLVGIYNSDVKGNILYINDALVEMLEFNSREEFKQQNVQNLYKYPQKRKLFIEQLKKTEKVNNYELELVTKSGKSKNILISASIDGEIISGMIMDITERKKSEEALKRNKDELEARVKERTEELEKANKELLAEISERKRIEEELRLTGDKLRDYARELEDTNTALKVLLKHRENDKRNLEENIMSNLRHLVLPYIEKLKKNQLSSRELSFLRILESNLQNIIAPFSLNLSSQYLKFSPKEIYIANLIREGMHDKEIMDILNISLDTVKTHRKNIRKKLSICGKRANLRTNLLLMNN